MKKTLKQPQKPARRTGKALASSGGSVRCPCCDGSGKIPKDRIQQTKYTWTPKGITKAAKKKWQRKTSWLTIMTWSAPNGRRELPPPTNQKGQDGN